MADAEAGVYCRAGDGVAARGRRAADKEAGARNLSAAASESPQAPGWPRLELCGRLGDEIDQAAWWAGIWMTSMPFWNLTPWTTFGN